MWTKVCFVIYASLIQVATLYGLGFHFADIPKGNFGTAIKFSTVGQVWVILALQTSKTSFAITLLRIVTERRLVWVLWGTIITLNLFMGLDAILTITWCIPAEKIWDPTLPGSCWGTETIKWGSMFAGAYSGTIDLVLAGFPFFIVKPLEMNKKEKFGIIFAMSLGIFAGISAFIKTSYLPQLSHTLDLTCKTSIFLGFSFSFSLLSFVNWKFLLVVH